MKKKSLNLKLNKQVISALNNNQKASIKGGFNSAAPCPNPDPGPSDECFPSDQYHSCAVGCNGGTWEYPKCGQNQ